MPLASVQVERTDSLEMIPGGGRGGGGDTERGRGRQCTELSPAHATIIGTTDSNNEYYSPMQVEFSDFKASVIKLVDSEFALDN